MPAEPHRDAACAPAISTGRPARSTRRSRSWTQAAESKKPISVGLLGNAADIFPELVRRGVRPDIVTDQTSAHDPINGYLPKGWTLAEWETRRQADPKAVEAAAKPRWSAMSRPCWISTHMGIPTLDYGNNIRQMAKDMGLKNAFDFPGFVPAYIRPLFCRGIGPFRWAALSGDPEDIFRTDAKVKELMPERQASSQLARHGPGADPVPGVCRPGSAGSALATATGWAWRSMKWWRTAN